MRCLFCKRSNVSSRSDEHVIPQSLGNHSLVLPAGIVCDSCNNYFSREVEKPFMDSPVIRHLRYRQALLSKRGRGPAIGVVGATGGTATLTAPSRREPASLMFDRAENLIRLLGQPRAVVLSHDQALPPSSTQVSRLLAKVALEFMASRLRETHGGLDYLIDEVNLDRLRNHARRGTDRDWPTSVRRIYPADAHGTTRVSPVQRVWELCLFEDGEGCQYSVLALFGLEMVIHIGEPDISGYRRWLVTSGGRSPLFVGSNAADQDNLLVSTPGPSQSSRRVLLGYRT